MVRSSKIVVGTLIVFLIMSLIITPMAMAFTGGFNFNFESLFKLFGVGFIVRQFGPQINEAINMLAFQRKMETVDVTKVVPIVSAAFASTGSAAYIGAAQISGPKEMIEKVEAVAQIEGDFQRTFRLKLLIPVDSINPLQMKRVFGVGVSAIIDISL